MTGKVWRGSKKLLAFALTLVMVVGVMQAAPMVRAEEVNNSTETAEGTEGGEGTTTQWSVTFTAGDPKYNIAKGKLEHEVTISAASKPIKYYVINWATDPNGIKNMNDEADRKKAFDNATLDVDGSATVTCEVDDFIAVWYVKQDADKYKPLGNEGDEDYYGLSDRYESTDNNYQNEENQYKLLCTKGNNQSFYKDSGNLITWQPTVSYNDAEGCFSVVDNNTNTYGDYKTSNNLKLVQMIYFSTSNPGSGDDPGKRIQHRGTEYPIVGSDGKLNASIDILPDLNEDGYYTCYFWLETLNGAKKRSTVYKYSTFQYKKGQSLPKVSNIEWDETTPGKITFSTVTDNDCKNKVSGYYITLYRQAPGDGTAAFGQVQWVGGTETNPACDFSKFMTDANAQYWVSIRTNSNAPLEWATAMKRFHKNIARPLHLIR